MMPSVQTDRSSSVAGRTTERADDWPRNSQSDMTLDSHNQSKLVFNETLLLPMNDEMTITLLPAIICLALLMLVGSVGNSLSVYIFGWKLKRTTQNCLFMWLGVFDMVSCLIGIPSEIVDMAQYFLYENAVACKVMRFLLTMPPIASANLLVLIAIDRYRRVCKPLHGQMELKHARIGVGLSSLVALVMALPALRIYGHRSVKTPVEGLMGCDCSVQDKFKGRLYPLLYELIFGAAFLLYTVALTVLYLRVWMETRRHREYLATHAIPAINLSSLLVSEADDSSGAAMEVTPDATPNNTPAPPRKLSRSILQSDISVKIRKSLKANKLTVIAVAVTVVFVVSYLPHLVLITLRTVVEDFDHNQKGAALVLYNLFLRSFFFNSVANVFVYSVMNSEFKQHCKKLCVCCKRLSDQDPPPVAV